MGRMLQKKKNRSSIPRATQKPKSKRLPIKASPIIAAHWDKHLTLSQNYRKLGLASKINARSGGTEPGSKANQGEGTSSQTHDPLAVGVKRPAETSLKTAKVVRDEKGNISRVIHDEKISNPLNDPLMALETENVNIHNHGNEGVIHALEAAAAAELADVKRRKKPRKQSQREQEWIERLVEKYGDDVGAMAWDKR
ncbi:MAG: hypothetical protein Q9191_008363, partial [Dirinaria sp. TL-2023a]